MDADGVESAASPGMSMGGLRALLLASGHPERVNGAFLIGAGGADAHPGRRAATARLRRAARRLRGLGKYNRHSWLSDYRGFLEFFFAQVFPEPHSTKQIEDCVGWGLETTPETLDPDKLGATPGCPTARLSRRSAGASSCPAFVVHGTADEIVPVERGEGLAELTGAELVRLEGSGHARTPATR